MKIAIFHDYFDEIGGAEFTLLYMARGLSADIYTTNIDRASIDRSGFSDINIFSIGRTPNIRHLKQMITQLRFAALRLSHYDFYVFGGAYSIHASRNHKPNIWFCFSPLRGLYDLRHPASGAFNIIKKPALDIQTAIDKRAVEKIEKMIAPSLNVKKRIEKYYHRDADIVYSPVDTSEFSYQPSKDYWLSVGRIDPYKRTELLIKAFSEIREEHLIVVGGSSYEYKSYFDKLKNSAPENITFMGPIFDRKKLADIYSHCKGFVATAKGEDFGMTPVEAMASGKPVIAPNEGGFRETVIDNVTGKLLDDISSESLAAAVKELSANMEKYKDSCLNQAKNFDVKIFVEKIKKHITIAQSTNKANSCIKI